jgi:uncharacterized repeat protein (TIGR03803 family)
MRKLNWMTKACGVLLLWATAAVALPAQTLTTLFSFDGADGFAPAGALIQATDGSSYGTTQNGGVSDSCEYGCGTVFKIAPDGTLTTLHSFCSLSNCADGSLPEAGLVQASNGDFYGTTLEGGREISDALCEYGCGTVFKVTAAGVLTSVYKFCALTNCADGSYPEAGLIQAANGDFYGTTRFGGANNGCFGGCGTVFKLTPSGTLTTLHSFCSQIIDGNCEDGDFPTAGLIQAADGNLYGTTYDGGANSNCNGGYGCGTVFEITTSGTLTTLHSFDGADGDQPWAGLVQASNGDFYGTTLEGGANSNDPCASNGFNGCGTVFEITPSGTLTTLHNFCSTSNCPDGSNPYAGLVQATDGNLYGTTNAGGANDNVGTAFKITPSGALTTLYSFIYPGTYEPFATLVQGTSGNLYGTTLYGGGDEGAGDGSIFSLSVGLRPFVETRPASGAVGAAVNILGSNLTGTTSVTFNGTAAVFTVASQYLITTTVPVGATSGKVDVTIPGATLSSNVPFTVK